MALPPVTLRIQPHVHRLGDLGKPLMSLSRSPLACEGRSPQPTVGVIGPQGEALHRMRMVGLRSLPGVCPQSAWQCLPKGGRP